MKPEVEQKKLGTSSKTIFAAPSHPSYSKKFLRGVEKPSYFKLSFEFSGG
jgi:hypothetical protein